MVIDKHLKSYKKEIAKTEEFTFDENIVRIITISLGPSVYLPISQYIDFEDEEEMKKVKVNFLINRLNLKDSKVLDKTLKRVSAYFVKHKLKNYRVLYYYFIVKELRLDDILIESTNNVESTGDIEDKFLEFGERLIKNQKDIDLDLKKILDDNFASLL